jgi:hypothetical protein
MAAQGFEKAGDWKAEHLSPCYTRVSINYWKYVLMLQLFEPLIVVFSSASR